MNRVGRIVAIIGLVAAAPLVVLSAADRVLTESAVASACKLPTNQRCVLALTGAARRGEIDRAALDAAGRMAQRRPFDPAAQSALGVMLAKTGNAAAADHFLAASARLGWRDGAASLWAYYNGLAQGDRETAIQRLDALLRVRPQVMAQPDLFAPLLRDPVASAAFAGKLASNPPYTSELLRAVSAEQGRRAEPWLGLLTTARKQGFRANPDELVAQTWSIAARDPALGAAYWEAVAGAGGWANGAQWYARATDRLLDRSQGPFGWAPGGEEIGAIVEPGTPGGLLFPQSTGRNSAGVIASIILRPPSDSRLVARASGDTARLRIAVACAGAEATAEAQTLVSGATTLMRPPSSQCPVQSVVLRSGGGLFTSDTRVSLTQI